jgi:thioredoxin-related protein
MNTLKCLIFGLLVIISSVAYGENNKTLLMFTAKWCKFCQIAKNDINNDPQIKEAIKAYDVVIIDSDVDKDLVKGHNVKSLPTFIVFENGKERERLSGYDGSRKLLKLLK